MTLIALAGLLVWTAPAARAGEAPQPRFDFDGDGRGDLIVGSLWGSDNRIPATANLLFGSTGLLTEQGDLLLTQSSEPACPEMEGEGFGSTLATGDFDGDGKDDVAAGAPHENLSTSCVGAEDPYNFSHGAVHVVYGPEGTRQLWHQGIDGVPDDPESGSESPEITYADRFGWALAAADFDDDGFDDLAIGVPYDDVEHLADEGYDEGSVQILYGAPAGLGVERQQYWTRKDVRPLESSRGFGGILAAGDFDGSGHPDLIIGHEWQAGVEWAVLPGSDDGLSAGGAYVVPSQTWTTATTGDFDADDFDDLAAGAPFDDFQTIGGEGDSGSVDVVYGSSDGLTPSRHERWSQDSPGVRGTAEGGDRFGFALASGDLNGDGFDELVVGAPCEDVAGVGAGGVAYVLFGSPGGVSAEGDERWSQASSGIKGTVEWGDRLGEAIWTNDFDGDGIEDLAVGVLYEDLGSLTWAGEWHVLRGTTAGLTSAGDQLWHRNAPGIKGVARKYDVVGILPTG